jgi:hypothetical protein
MNLRLKDVFYFPSFEILRWLAPMVDGNVWFEDGQLSHVRNAWTAYTMSKFMQYYCVGETPLSPPFHGNPTHGSEG